MTAEEKYNQLLADNAILVAENESLRRAIAATRIAVARLERRERLKHSGLPREACDRIEQKFTNALTNDGLRTAINTEKDSTPITRLQESLARFKKE